MISDHDGGGSDLRSAEHCSAPPRQTACCCLIFSRPRFLPVVACVAASGWPASAGPGCVAASYWPGFFIKLKICGVVAEASCPVLCLLRLRPPDSQLAARVETELVARNLSPARWMLDRIIIICEAPPCLQDDGQTHGHPP